MTVRLNPPSARRTYRIFLSSGDDAVALRERIDQLISEAINSQLIDANADLRIEIDKWERTAATSNNPDESTNDRFVAKALDSDLTLALLLDKIGNGTKEEIEATLDAKKPVSVLWFVPRNSQPNTPVAKFLAPKRDLLYWDKTGRPEDDASWHGIVRIALSVVLSGLTEPQKGPYFEQR